jgi:Ser/Thr protein kinase RdoA (MazF antagonist)
VQPPTEDAVRAAVERFPLDGELIGLRPLRRGHIHDTFVSRWRGPDGERQFIHQRMNQDVFPDLELLMGNIQRVSAHLVDALRRNGDEGFEPLQLVPTSAGEAFTRTPSGAWRTFVFIENTSSVDRCRGPDQAYEAARAFGWFQAQLRDLPAHELGETLPRFFSTPHRLEQFRAALAAASEERKASCAEEIAFVLARAGMTGVIESRLDSGLLPRRVVHGDTKLNNILFDDASGKARGIVDLDTCMAGYSLYDFGDLVRFGAATSDEDETDLSLVGTDLGLYQAMAEGYLSMARRFLTPEEVELMPFAARLVTFTIGLRFLADHLAGDVYFKVHRHHHNLDRARVQLGMVAFMERHEALMGVA